VPRRSRPAIAALVAVALTVPLGTHLAGADTDDDAAERAAAEIAAAQQRANDAAEAYFDALSELEQLEDEATRLTADAAELELEVEALREPVSRS
jgi:hypothetical protein